MISHAFSLRRLATAAALLLTAMGSQAQTVALDDASFELSNLGVSWFDSTGSASIAPTDGYNVVAAQDGTQYARLDFDESIYQSFSVNAGTTYTVNFWATGEGRSQVFGADLGTALGTSGDPSTAWGAGWHQASYSFTATVDYAKLYFSGKGTFFGVDNVQVTAAPVPEPETMSLLLAGLGVIGFMARRRQR